MNWQWTPYLIPLFITVGVLLAAALYLSWREQVAPGRGAVVSFMLANAGWATGYIFEVAALDLEVKKSWAALEFIFVTIGVVSLFAYTVQYTGRDGWLTRRRLLGLTLPLLVITTLPFFPQTEALFWREFSLPSVGGLVLFKYEFGPALSIYYAAVYLLLMITVIWLAEMYFRSRNLYRAQTLLLILSVLIPWLGSAIDLLEIIPIELGALSTSVTALCVGWSLVSFRLGEVIPVARETIIEVMHDGVIVLDPDQRIVDVNPTARHLLKGEMLGQPIDQLWPKWPVLLETALRQAGRGGEMRFDHSDGRHIYD
ncbi:MAG: PAS domain-containing protein, partial [Anaerolineae bacterium]|nr:PAS domain-containing protein [Anaerolineae bacterium]